MKQRDGGLRPMFKTKLPHYFFIAVENPISGGGVPDHHWCCRGISGWNEYKVVSGLVISFRPEQIGWHKKYARYGGRSFIIIRKVNKKAGDELWIYRGADADKHMMKFEEPLLKFEGGPARWDWLLIDKTLGAKRPAK